MRTAYGQTRLVGGAADPPFMRRIISRGVDARGPFTILECQHKVRKHANNPDEVARWCKSCENKSPFR